ncbi:MAG: Coenzyme F420 hydrogenase/dehydrogenase, beta subunit C-terminal domain [Methanothrix sp.]
MKNHSITETARRNLCTGCGTCAAICPQEAINLLVDSKKGVFLPTVDEELCNECGICIKACPGQFQNLSELNMDLFGHVADDFWIGNHVACYTGYALDEELRYDSSSGGLITQLLVWALDEGIINGALVTRMSKENPLMPEPIIARNKNELIEASKSKYCPVPANIAIKEILRCKDNEKFAVVGLPCHILALRKAEKFNNNLRNKVIYHMGIFCSHTVTFLATEMLLNNININISSINEISYRGGGWPGGLSIELKNGLIIKLPKSNYYDISFGSFIPVCCRLCSDHTNILADISFGDAWLKEYESDRIGRSIIISRNVAGEELLQEALAKGVIQLDQINSEKVRKSQNGFYRKKNELAARAKFYNYLYNSMPLRDFKLPRANVRDIPMVAYHEAFSFFSSKRSLWFMLKAQNKLFKLLSK